jgi:outer membrane protein assembly factor BamB
MYRKEFMKMRFLSTILITVSIVSTCFARDWPQYLGPNRNGFSVEKGINTNWSQKEPAVLWRQQVGTGFGGAAIHQGKVYLLDRVDGKNDLFRCFDLESGRELWHYSHNDSGTFDFNGSRAIPTIADDEAYCVGAMGTFYCISLTDRKPFWIRNFLKDFDAELPFWAFSQSPVIYQDLVIVAPQLEQVGVVAYDRKSGEMVWKTARLSHNPGYASPTLTRIDGIDQLVVVTPYEIPGSGEDEEEEEEEKDAGPRFEGGGVYGIDAKTGKILWNYQNFNCAITIPPVTVIGDGRFFINGGYDAKATMIKVRRQGDGFVVEELFKNPDVKAAMHPAVLFQNHLYINGNGNEKRDGLLCLTLDGEVLWKTKRKPNFERGGLVMVDGKVFIVDGRRGNLYFAEVSPAGYTELGKIKLLNPPNIWAPLALSEGKLVIRDQKQMICVDVN